MKNLAAKSILILSIIVISILAIDYLVDGCLDLPGIIYHWCLNLLHIAGHSHHYVCINMASLSVAIQQVFIYSNLHFLYILYFALAFVLYVTLSICYKVINEYISVCNTHANQNIPKKYLLVAALQPIVPLP